MYCLQILNKEITVFIILFAVTITQIFTGVLVNIDRSRSFYVLSWIHKSEIKVVSEGYDLKNIHSMEKLNNLAINQRIDEQISRGLVVLEDKKLRLSFIGTTLVNISDKTAQIFDLKGWKANYH